VVKNNLKFLRQVSFDRKLFLHNYDIIKMRVFFLPRQGFNKGAAKVYKTLNVVLSRDSFTLHLVYTAEIVIYLPCQPTSLYPSIRLLLAKIDKVDLLLVLLNKALFTISNAYIFRRQITQHEPASMYLLYKVQNGYCCHNQCV